jgi:hypothetical protein
MKGLVIGFPKSGTSTIHKACDESGLKTAHWKTASGYCGKLIYDRYLAGQDPLLDFANYDLVAQLDVCRPRDQMNYWPNLDIAVLLAIRRYHPECCFILNVRETNKIISSISRWGSLRRRLTMVDIVGLPAGYGDKDDDLRNWIEGHYGACRAIFGGDKKFIELQIENENARDKLAKALEVDIRWWGVANENTKKPEQGSGATTPTVKTPALSPSKAAGAGRKGVARRGLPGL